ncbi:hypothetical protein [Bacillus sp. 1P06AnD]|uniref:hypothetical protein n=1 Tax=Bacillus sp. 1P06AnD TaxID=3132208 RepID=UPI0039A1DECB
MAYKVINRFFDMEDNSRLYEVGDTYPKGSHKPSKKRIEELSKEHPKEKCAFIEEVKAKKAKE